MGRRRKVVLGVLGALALVLIAIGTIYGPILADFARAGFFEKQEKRDWEPETRKNLEVIQTALKLVHDSDGVYPKAAEWMDKIKNRIRTEDLSKTDALQKLVDPAAGGAQGVYGFAFNEAASEQYIDDLPQKGETILVFQSVNTEWNAHGTPEEVGRPRGFGITAAGDIVELNSGLK
jgi:hypothetical protein